MDKQEILEAVAKKNNFDSYDRAIRYTFNRELLPSEREFILKIITESMEEYAEQEVKKVKNPILSEGFGILFKLVDIVWGDALEDGSVPSTAHAKKLIEKAINSTNIEKL